MPDVNTALTDPWSARLDRYGEGNEQYQEQGTLPNPLQQRSKKSFEEYAGASNLGGVPSGQQFFRREGVRYPTDKVKSFRSELRPPQWQETHWLGSFKSEEAAMKAFDAALFYTGKLPIHFIYPLNHFPPLPSHLPSIKNREALHQYVKSLARDVSDKRKEFKSILKKMAKEASKRTTKLQPHVPQAKLDDMAYNIPTVAGIRQFRPTPHFGKSLSPTFKELAQVFPKAEKKAKAPHQESSEGKSTASVSLSTSLMDPALGHEDVYEWLSDAPELRPDFMNWLPDRAPSIPSAPSTGDCCSESFLTDSSHGLLWDTSSSAGEPSVDSAPQQEVPDVGASSLEQVLLPSKGFVLGEEDFNIAEETTSMQIQSLRSFNDDTPFSNYEMQFLQEVLSIPGMDS